MTTIRPISMTTNQQNIYRQPKMSKMDAMFERYDDVFTEAEKELMNNVADTVVDTVKGKGYSDKQIDTMMKKIMSAFETLSPKEQEEYVDAAVKFLANA